MFWWGVIGLVLAGMVSGGTSGYKYHARLAKGYCPSKGRILSEEKLMDDAVFKLIDLRQNLRGKKIKFLEKDSVKYSSVEEFYALNPNCCAIALATTKNIYAPYLRIRYNSNIIGNKYYVLIIKYLDTSEQSKTAQQIVDVCGNRHADPYGPMTSGPYLKTREHNFRPDVGKINRQSNSEE